MIFQYFNELFFCLHSDDSEGNNEEPQEHEVELDIDLTAQANARKYYDKKKYVHLFLHSLKKRVNPFLILKKEREKTIKLSVFFQIVWKST